MLLPLLAMAQADRAQVKPDLEAYGQGEYLQYTLRYGSVSAGEAVLQVDDKTEIIGGRPHNRIVISGRSFAFFDAFYRVRDHYETYVDQKTLLPSIFIRNVSEGSYQKKEYYLFNQARQVVKSGDKEIAVGPQTHDLVSAFYYLRCIDFSKAKVGTFVPIEAFFDEEKFPLGITYMGVVNVTTGLGTFRCRYFKPKLVEGRIFTNQSDMSIYVTDDDNQLPIRIESFVYLGYVRADLKKFKGLRHPLTSKITKK